MSHKTFTIETNRRLRTVFLTGDIFSSAGIESFQNEVTLLLFSDLYTNKPMHKPITIVVCNCPGGSLDNMFCFEAILRYCKQRARKLRFNVHCIGSVNSSAAIFVCSDVFSESTADRNATFLVHDLTTTLDAEKNRRQLLSYVVPQLERGEDAAIGYYLRKSQSTEPERFRALVEAGNMRLPLTAGEFHALGLVDRVLD